MRAAPARETVRFAVRFMVRIEPGLDRRKAACGLAMEGRRFADLYPPQGVQS